MGTMAEPLYELPYGMARASFRAMGTTVSAYLPAGRLDKGTGLIRGLFEEWEATLSRFRADSEVTKLSASSGRYVKVSGLLYQVLSTALDAARATRGLYDPSLRARMAQIGYDRSFDAVAPQLPPPVYEKPVEIGAWRRIQMDDMRRMVRLPQGTGLDFGGIARGMAVDAAMSLLAEARIGPALVNAGGDLAVRGLPLDIPDWPVMAPGKGRGWVIGLRRGALATSSVGSRRWRQGEVQRHHLIDPRNGEPVANGLWSVTVVASNCAQAEVAAKAALILGEDRGVEFIEEAGLAVLFVRDDGSWATAGAWPRESMRPLNRQTPPAMGQKA